MKEDTPLAKLALAFPFICILLFLVAFEPARLPAQEKVRRSSYIGARACGNCHAAKYESFRRTAHHLTSRLPEPASILGKFTPEQAVLRTRNPDTWFEMSSGEGGFYQAGSTRTEDGVRRRTERIDISVGSGKIGQTYLYWKGNQLFQLPVSYFTGSGRWINSPGYVDGLVNFDRPIVPRCLECHATYFEDATHHTNTYSREHFVLGISCERCHGPGSEHEANQGRHPKAVGAPYIVDPRRLEPQRKNEICAQCHSGLGKPLKPPFSFLPGEPLDRHIELESLDDQNRIGVHSVNQLARLSKSKCFAESEGMTCVSCHDPHTLERGNRELFSTRCLNCHKAHDCGLAPQLGDAIRKDCISCHMPHLQDRGTGMETASGMAFPLMAEHFISIYPEATRRVMKQIAPLEKPPPDTSLLSVSAQDLPAIPGSLEQQLESFAPERRQQLLAVYDRVLASPTEDQANGDLGMLFHAFEQYELASTFYQRAHLLQPDSFRWVYYWATVRANLGQTTEAIAILRKALELDPNDLPAQLKLAEFLFTTGDREECARIYEEVVGRHPDNAVAQHGLGRIQAGKGDLTAAAESYRKASQLVPGFAAAHYALAMVYRSLGEMAKSKEHLHLFDQHKDSRTPLEEPLMDPIRGLASNAQNHFQKGLRFQGKGQMQEAIAEFELTLKEDPQFMPAHVNVIRAYGALGQFDKAEQKYQAAVGAAPNMFEVHHNFGILRKLQGRKNEAADAFRKALEINPFWAESHYQLAVILVSEGRLADAERHCRAAVENKPSLREAHFILGWILQRQGKDTEAIPEFLKAVKVEDKQTPGFMYILANSYARVGNIEKAIHYAKEARRLAITFGQTPLVTSIEKLLQLLEPREGK